ncbi:MAG: outer membrane beta-barrel protein [Hyphomicrobiales bacterium]|nr:outer membrane beta-barrel protein [Hyphomicrobiales bacterium]
MRPLRKFFCAGIACLAIIAADPANAAEMPLKAPRKAVCDPYKNYGCLDTYLGEDFWTRLINYYRLEWGKDSAPSDPKAPPSRRAGWPPAPQATPPHPFTEWPYGGSTNIGVTRPSSVDSPLMAALGNTELGKAMNDAHVQVYGWISGGGNISTNTVHPGGNWPAAYMYTPNTVQLDQAVMFIERLPDTVQTDHIDWGFRVAGLYGENYRYTMSYRFASYQLLGRNDVYGYDFPNLYGEIYSPFVADGLMLRFGKFFSLFDIESPTAPSNYMYSHSMLNTFDNYTHWGVVGTLALNKNWFVQLGLVMGTDTAIWTYGRTVPNPFPNPVFPGTTMPEDPGNQPSLIACARYQSDDAKDSVYACANGINDGTWGYNNLQTYALTWYHKFDDRWHFAWETFTSSQRNVLNAADPGGIIANGGYPFTPANGVVFNAPNFAQCSDPATLACTARVFASVFFLNYKASPLDNLTLRLEYYDDQEGQRTGVKTRYSEIGVGWQHWFSPQVEIRPEIAYYRSWDAAAFNGNFNATPVVPPNKSDMWMAAMDLIWHY